MIEVRARLLLALCSVGLQNCTFWCTIATPFGPTHWGRGRRTNALVQPQAEGCGERSRALHRRRGQAYALWRYRLLGLPEGVQEAPRRWDERRAGHDLRGAPLQDVAPEAPTPRLAQDPKWRAEVSHEIRRSTDRREGKGERVWASLRVAGAYGHDQRKVGQPRVPGPRRAAGGRAHAAVLAPRVRRDQMVEVHSGQDVARARGDLQRSWLGSTRKLLEHPE